eukprot:4471391-Pyramimonas_sp.AAC.1
MRDIWAVPVFLRGGLGCSSARQGAPLPGGAARGCPPPGGVAQTGWLEMEKTSRDPDGVAAPAGRRGTLQCCWGPGLAKRSSNIRSHRWKR